MSRNQLQDTARLFCQDVAANKDPQSLLQHFSVTHNCSIIEHGHQSLAPYLGHTFVGLPAIHTYFNLKSELLAHENIRFSGYIVDTESSRVSVKGEAKSTWLGSGETWDETFLYMLDFDAELKVTDCQIWADSGAVYLARTGKLDEVQKAHGDARR